MASIRLQDVTKIYRSSDLDAHDDARTRPRLLPQSQKAVAALDHVTLTVQDGETMAIVGPSGCGKSTLLRAIAGLIDYEGDIFYDDQNVREIPVKDRYIGMVFQDYALYPHFEGQGNLRFFFDVHKAPNAEAEERIRVTSEIMGIGFKELLRRKPGKLSGGQRQRVAIARALVRKPKLFLFDEPLSNLDAKLRTQTRVEIQRLLHRFHITAVYVTHDQVEAIAIGDRIAVMREGQIVQVGTYQELQEAPRDAFVAGFLGLPPMNLLEGRVQGNSLRLADARIPLPPAVAAGTQEGQAVTLGIHADAAYLNTPDTGDDLRGPCLKATIDVVEPDFGRRRQVAYVHTGELSYGVVAPTDVRLTPGYDVEVVFPTTALHFFDTESQARIGAPREKEDV